MAATIRPSTKRDVDDLIRLWREFMRDPSSIDRPIPTHDENAKRQRGFVSKLIEEDPRQVHVAEANGRLVGYVMCQKTVKSPLEMPYVWSFVTDLFVEPAFRRRGIGKELLQACLGYLKSTGCKHVRLVVWYMNEAAIRLYRELGFREHMEVLQTDL
jgi:ribosomal protein S18 acetylase RimI-like enzyme